MFVPLLWGAVVALTWFSWYEPYVGLDMAPILKLRNYSIIGGDSKIATPVDLTGLYGGIPLPPVPTKPPQQGGAIWTLWNDSMTFFAVMESGFLVIFPALKLFWMLIVWIVPMSPKCFVLMVKIQRFIGKWAMLDVFCIGTQLFIHEAGKYITMKALPGLKWMWFLLFFSYTLDIFFALAVNSTIDSVKQMAYILDNNNEAFTEKHKASLLYAQSTDENKQSKVSLEIPEGVNASNY
jgi:hypothetical protein